MRYKNYEQVSQLATDISESLLISGDAQEQVWAAWEVGMRFGASALPRVLRHARQAPDPGTRRRKRVLVKIIGG